MNEPTEDMKHNRFLTAACCARDAVVTVACLLSCIALFALICCCAYEGALWAISKNGLLHSIFPILFAVTIATYAAVMLILIPGTMCLVWWRGDGNQLSEFAEAIQDFDD